MCEERKGEGEREGEEEREGVDHSFKEGYCVIHNHNHI